MSGAHVLVAARELEASVRAIVLVDTLKNLDARQPAELVDRMLASYRSDYAGAVRGVLPAFLYSPATPASVVARLSAEFLEVSGDEAAARLEPYLRFDPREVAQRTVVPVRAIDGDLHPANEAVSRAYFRDFARRELSGCGHYPMIEQPEAFVAALRETLAALGLA
jgi:pimeloyl-ACP methyl ester carboxylesterase